MSQKLVDFGTVTKLSLDWDIKHRRWRAQFFRIGANPQSGLSETYILDQVLVAEMTKPVPDKDPIAARIFFIDAQPGERINIMLPGGYVRTIESPHIVPKIDFEWDSGDGYLTRLPTFRLLR